MVTIKEIAKAVGVSSATVSRVLNFDATLSVAPATRQSIIETAEALNYATPRARKNAAQQQQQGLNKIALVHFLRPEQELIDPYYVGVRLGIESRCQALKIETVRVYQLTGCPSRRCCKVRPVSSRSAVTTTPKSTGSSATAGTSSSPTSRRQLTMPTASNATLHSRPESSSRASHRWATAASPLPAGSMFTTALFMANWNCYLWPLIILITEENKTVTLIVSALSYAYVPDYGVIMISAVFATLPTLLIFFLLQRRFVEGLLGSVK